MEEYRDIEVDELMEKLGVLNKLYDYVRLVDPVRKKVIRIDKGNLIETESYCFDAWSKNRVCDNCISVRAYNDNKTFVKIEYNQQKVYMVTAVPIEFRNKRVIIEFMKDSTNTFLIGEPKAECYTDVCTLIDKLNTAVFKDELTQTYNRRFINERLPVDVVNAFMLDKDLSIIMLDLDYFKNINDTYGHMAGDEVLIKFSEVLKQSIRRSDDWVARYGGEEFLICLPGASADTAEKIAENMRKSLEALRFDFCSDSVKITSSFGVCSIKEVGDNKFEALIDCADKKLYKAKYNGRNRVEK